MAKPQTLKRAPKLRDLVLDATPVVVGADGVPLTRFRLAAFGRNETTKGPFTLTKKDAAAMVERAKQRKLRNIDLSSDYEHAAVHAAAKGTPAPASSWFDLELGDDGLYVANAQWTKPALAHFANREYRYVSPWFGQREDGSVATFKNFALTNRPAMDDLMPLVASEDASDDEAQPPEKPNMETLLKTLALSEDATEAEAVAKVNAMNTERDAVFTATGAKDLPAALAFIETSKRDAAEAKGLKAKLEEITKGAEKKERDMLLSEAVESGAIPPNMKDFWASDSMSLEQLKAYVEKVGKPAKPGSKAGAKDVKEKDVGEIDLALTEDDKSVAKHMGITEEDFAKHKKATLGRA